jgi:hypothetical protein
MTDHILSGFLRRQYEEGMALAVDSDLLTLIPLEGDPPQRYIAEYRCTGLTRTSSGEIAEANRFAVGIWFPDDYLRHAEPFQVLTWLAPRNVWHPNISSQAPIVCPGRLVAATSLVEILWQIFEIITYNKVTMREDDALNREACGWARANLQHFPIDRRPLKRRALEAPAAAAPGPDLDFDVVEVPR